MLSLCAVYTYTLQNKTLKMISILFHSKLQFCVTQISVSIDLYGLGFLKSEVLSSISLSCVLRLAAGE